MDIFHSGEKMLERNRFQFPGSWLHVDNIEGEWSAFNEIMKRKDGAMQSQVRKSQLTGMRFECFRVRKTLQRIDRNEGH